MSSTQSIVTVSAHPLIGCSNEKGTTYPENTTTPSVSLVTTTLMPVLLSVYAHVRSVSVTTLILHDVVLNPTNLRSPASIEMTILDRVIGA